METSESVHRVARERLYPSLTNPNWLVLRRRREIFRNWISGLGTGLDVLDVGGRVQPYRPLLANRLHSYVAIDLRGTPVIDVVARGEQIPFATGHFDVVICTQVLEYVEEPVNVIREMHRVLKAGGVLLLSVPAMALRDGDEEFYRFLPFAVRHLLREFAESEVVAEGGSIIGLFRTLNSGLDVFTRYPVLRKFYRWTLCPTINGFAEALNWLSRSTNDQLANNYAALARK
jgi:SAM-dependent methyltransferase